MRTTPVALEKFGTMHYLTAHEEAIENNELVDAVNVVIDEHGVINRRRGFDNVVNITGPAISARVVGRHRTSAMDSVFMAHVGGLALVNATGSAVTWNDVSFVNVMFAVQFNNQSFVFSYQVQQMLNVDFAGTRTGSWANVQASLGLVHKGRIFCCNNRVTPADTVRFSQIYTDPTNPNWSGAGAWPAANTLSISQGDGEMVTAMVEYNDSIIIFKQSSTWILYTDGSPTTGWQLKKLHDSIGCVGTHTPKVVGSLLYFMGVDGVYRTDGTTFEEISEPINAVWRLFSHSNASVMYNRTAVEWDGLYIVNPDWSDDMWYIFNTRNDTWTRWLMPTAFSGPTPFEESPLRPLRALTFQGSGTTVNWWEMTDSSLYQDGEAGTLVDIGSEIIFKKLDFGEPDQWKYIPTINIAFERRFAAVAETTCQMMCVCTSMG